MGLGAQLFRINRDNGQTYSMQVLSQQAYENQTIPFKRGKILDSKGTVLADSQLVYNVIVDSKQILQKDVYLEPTLDALESLGVNRNRIKEYITNHASSQYYIALNNLPYQDRKAYLEKVAAGIAQEKEKKIPAAQRKYDNIKGIWFESGYQRFYPHGDLACDVLGFSGSGNVGTGGLEEYYNDTLNGVVGRKYGYLDEGLNMEQTMIEAKDGNNLVLTLDANIQSIVQKCLNEFNDAFQNQYREGLGANNAACIIMDCNNGEVLAMAGTPFFDLNHPSDLAALWGMPKLDENDEPQDGYLTYTDLLTMTEEDKPRYLNALWRNFCISDYYEPGSTAKPFTVAMGLDTGNVSDSDTYYCGGYKMIDGFKIQCHNRDGDGWLTTGEAVEYSCNVALMEMAEKIGKDNFTKFQNVYNFGLKTGIDLADEARTDQFVSDATMTNSMLATNSFGQNFDVTMIQMLSGFCSLINGGNYYEPHIVKKITSASGTTLKTIEPRILKKTVSESTSAHIRDYTVMVVEGHDGTGITARPAGYRIGGKTGTAETLPRGNDEYVVSFIGYAPVNDPQIACYVVVDRPNVEEQDNPMYATAIFRNVMEEVLPYMGIYMSEPVTDTERERLDRKGLEVTYTGDESPDKWDWADNDEEMY
ncbi:MAG: penicillin-binding protein 2 [Lachnospiraceae bacterium]|nr:penicillin-binding protein 2 [Lachnospiraceae bacterium]